MSNNEQPQNGEDLEFDKEAFLEERRNALKESVRYFERSNAAQRERWVVRALLENLGEPFDTDEISSNEDDPPDVTFRGAAFEVKEILDPGRRRHDEYKAEAMRAETVTDPQDLLHFYTPVPISPYEISDMIKTELRRLSKKYAPAVRESLDCLFYVNLQRIARAFRES